MPPRFLFCFFLLLFGLTACASAPDVAPAEPAASSGISRLQAALANGATSLDALQARRETRNNTFFDGPPRSAEFRSCLAQAGLGARDKAQCEYAESVELQRQMSTLLTRLTADGNRPEEQSAWEVATRDGCAWLPQEEGTAGEVNASSCISNRLANRIAELSGQTCHFPAAEFRGSLVLCTSTRDNEEREAERLLDQRAQLDSSFRDASAYSRAYLACLDGAGGVTEVLVACGESERAHQQSKIDKALGTLSKARTDLDLQHLAWQRETRDGCAWYPTLEGSAARIDSASCMVNRLTNRAVELERSVAMESGRE